MWEKEEMETSCQSVCFRLLHFDNIKNFLANKFFGYYNKRLGTMNM
jgi:hypothetical protein